ncbi:MAG: permease [Tissierellia bacterium]|nr:permease [Tissierellia bacterium]
MSPIFLVCLVAALGYTIGKISLRGINLGTSAVLLVALIFGHFGYELPGLVRDLGLVLFVGAVGLLAGPVFIQNFKSRAFSYIMLGIAIVLTGAIVTCLSIYSFRIPADLGVGLFAGALTSTPGLATAIEMTSSDLASIGYGIAYPYGVVGVVLFIQIVPKLLRTDLVQEVQKLESTESVQTVRLKIQSWHQVILSNRNDLSNLDTHGITMDKFVGDLQCGDIITLRGDRSRVKKVVDHIVGYLPQFDRKGFLIFSLSLCLGVLIGNISLPLPGNLSFKLGMSGGPLVSGILIGHFRQIGRVRIETPNELLEVMQEFGLMLFLMGAGMNAGKGFVDVVSEHGMVLFIVGMLITTIPLIVGFILSIYVFKLDILNGLGAICGGMTSTPALGTLISATNTNKVSTSYASTYPIALVMMVVLTQIMIKAFI